MYLPDAYSVNDSGWLQESYKDKNGYIFGLTNTAYEQAAREIRLGNPNVTWETALKQNYGIDAYFLMIVCVCRWTILLKNVRIF